MRTVTIGRLWYPPKLRRSSAEAPQKKRNDHVLSTGSKNVAAGTATSSGKDLRGVRGREGMKRNHRPVLSATEKAGLLVRVLAQKKQQQNARTRPSESTQMSCMSCMNTHRLRILRMAVIVITASQTKCAPSTGNVCRRPAASSPPPSPLENEAYCPVPVVKARETSAQWAMACIRISTPPPPHLPSLTFSFSFQVLPTYGAHTP